MLRDPPFQFLRLCRGLSHYAPSHVFRFLTQLLYTQLLYAVRNFGQMLFLRCMLFRSGLGKLGSQLARQLFQVRRQPLRQFVLQRFRSSIVNCPASLFAFLLYPCNRASRFLCKFVARHGKFLFPLFACGMVFA